MNSDKVDEYINKQNSPQKEICIKLRAIIFHTFPNITEELKWGVPTYGNGQYYIASLKTHVHLGFSIDNLSSEEQKVFKGSGKSMKVLEFKTLDELNEQKVVKLLKLIDKSGTKKNEQS